MFELRRLHRLALARASNDIAKVEDLCFSGLAASPDDELLMGVLAELYWRNGRHEDAYAMAERALAINPGNFLTLRVAAVACVDLGDPLRAKAFAAQMLLTTPMSERRIVRGLVWLAFPISWIPRIRKALRNAKDEREADREWVKWATIVSKSEYGSERFN